MKPICKSKYSHEDKIYSFSYYGKKFLLIEVGEQLMPKLLASLLQQQKLPTVYVIHIPKLCMMSFVLGIQDMDKQPRVSGRTVHTDLWFSYLHGQ